MSVKKIKQKRNGRNQAPEAHERLRLRGDWEKAVAACKLLIEYGVNTEIVFVPTQFNIHEIGEIIDLACSLGVYGFYTGKTGTQ